MIQQDIKVATDACLFIGQDRCGRWVVRDGRGMCGGLFADRTAAIRFAMYECQSRPQSVIMLPVGLELDSLLEIDDCGAPENRRAA
ncbi:hypothetical protein [Roseiarcus sp.]|uniref:hypothetical protein n=1 Tax=Roseiarcus sp. TaxID=1969460 RepID=UPI003F9D8B66